MKSSTSSSSSSSSSIRIDTSSSREEGSLCRMALHNRMTVNFDVMVTGDERVSSTSCGSSRERSNGESIRQRYRMKQA